VNQQQRQFIDDALKLLLNLGKRENTVEDVAAVINVVVYILQKVLDGPENTKGTETTNKQAILEILDMLIQNEDGLRFLEGPDSAKTTLHKQAERLREKMIGEE
jgi:hypothetical protein